MTYVNIYGEWQVITVGPSITGCHYETELGFVAKVIAEHTS